MLKAEPHLIFGILSICMMLCSRAGYFAGIFRGKTRPHLFSWLIWGTISGIGFAAQAAEGAGPGSWARGFGSATCFLLAGISYFKGEKDIKRGDWVTLAVALSAVPLWMLTRTPFWSVLIVCFIDTIGYLPTVRKSWLKPQEELAVSYLFSCLGAAFSLLAIEQYTPSTWLYPLVLTLSNGAMWLFLHARRRVKPPERGSPVKALVILAVLLAAAWGAVPAAAETCLVKMTAVKGKTVYAYSKKNEAGKQDSFAGKVKARGGPARQLVFHSLLSRGQKGLFSLDYQFELSGAGKGRPPLQFQSRVSLPKGRKILAATAGGWKYYLELAGKSARPADTGDYQLAASYGCGSVNVPVRIVVVPGSQANAIIVEEGAKAVRKFVMTVLPGRQDADGTFTLQYQAELKDDGEVLGTAQGQVRLSAGGPQKTIPSGKNCRLSVKALKL